MNLIEKLKKIEKIFTEISSKRPLSTGEINELKKSLKVEFTYNSNAIEGSTLTRGETKLVIEDGLTIAGKTIREINETLNHNDLFEILYKAVKEKIQINEKFIFNIHKAVLKNIDDENAGVYRKIQVYISGEKQLPPKPTSIQKQMQDLLSWFEQEKNKISPTELAAKFHYKFVKIHPFIDGNGRTVRILINIILMQKNYPLIIIPNIRRAEYISTLNSKSSEENFLEFFADTVYENLKDYLRMISPDT